MEFKVTVRGLISDDEEMEAFLPTAICTGPLLSNKVYFEE